MLEFTKVKMESTKGIQPSKWDELAGQLEPGEAAEFDNETKASVAQGATRLRKLTGKPYHSGWNALTKKTFIRLRPDGEIPNKEDEPEEPTEEDKARLIKEDARLELDMIAEEREANGQVSLFD